jgi:hypothetical protein
LRNHGFSDEVIKLTEAVGHGALVRMRSGKATLSEKIIHYADDIVLGASISSLDARIDYLEKNPNYRELNESGKKIFHGKTYFEIQREVGHTLEKEFAEKLGLKEPAMLPELLSAKIYERIEKGK